MVCRGHIIRSLTCRDLRWQHVKSFSCLSKQAMKNSTMTRPERLWKALWGSRRYLMSPNKSRAPSPKSQVGKRVAYCLLLVAYCLFAACRYDMQDQPRYKAYKQSD